MMEWERPISMSYLYSFRSYPSTKNCHSARNTSPSPGRVLNIDFQEAQPAEHVIIEGHSTCLGWMRGKGWYDRPGVRILEGRWRDLFPSEATLPDNCF